MKLFDTIDNGRVISKHLDKPERIIQDLPGQELLPGVTADSLKVECAFTRIVEIEEDHKQLTLFK